MASPTEFQAKMEVDSNPVQNENPLPMEDQSKDFDPKLDAEDEGYLSPQVESPSSLKSADSLAHAVLSQQHVEQQQQQPVAQELNPMLPEKHDQLAEPPLVQLQQQQQQSNESAIPHEPKAPTLQQPYEATYRQPAFVSDNQNPYYNHQNYYQGKIYMLPYIL